MKFSLPAFSKGRCDQPRPLCRLGDREIILS
jgi:hypothetical protein